MVMDGFALCITQDKVMPDYLQVSICPSQVFLQTVIEGSECPIRQEPEWIERIVRVFEVVCIVTIIRPIIRIPVTMKRTPEMFNKSLRTQETTNRLLVTFDSFWNTSFRFRNTLCKLPFIMPLCFDRVPNVLIPLFVGRFCAPL